MEIDRKAIFEDAAARERRIAEIQHRIESGTYEIDLQRLAERIVDDDLITANCRPN